MTKLQYLRRKRAKGRDYYYFDAGKDVEGNRLLTPLPHIKDPRFGDCYARARAARTQRQNKKGILTLDGLIRSFEKSPEFYAKSQATKRSYTLYLGRANRLMRSGNGDSWPAAKIEKKDVIALRDELAETPGAASQAVRALSALYAWAIDNDKLKGNPASGVKTFEGKEHQPWPETLLEEALTDPQIGMAVALFYFTGQRINEVIKMRWDDIGRDSMRVFVQKKQNWIDVAILPELADMLKRQPKDGLTILLNSNGKPWGQGGLREKLQKWAKERGHHVVPHGLRKNAVNSLFEAGCTAAEVSGITDQSLGMLEHYAKGRNRLALGRAAVVKLDAARKARNKA